MRESAKVVSVVACATGGLETVASELVEPLLALGHQVSATLTPTAYNWLRASDDLKPLEAVTNWPVRSQPRLPSEPSPLPTPDVFVIAPASANTVAKLALGIADNQALTMLCEGIAVTPAVLFPRVNAAHARHPAWPSHLQALRSVGVDLIYGDDVWQKHEPRFGPAERALPWAAILEATERALLHADTRS